MRFGCNILSDMVILFSGLLNLFVVMVVVCKRFVIGFKVRLRDSVLLVLIFMV